MMRSKAHDNFLEFSTQTTHRELTLLVAAHKAYTALTRYSCAMSWHMSFQAVI